METRVFEENELNEAAKLLSAGGIVAFPTETVYGLGVVADNEEAFKKLVEVKQRSPEKPFTLMCCNFTQAIQLCEIDVASVAVMKEFMPGEITVLLRPRTGVPAWITLGKQTLGVRIPANHDTLALIEKVDKPLLVPSANKANKEPETSFNGVRDVFFGEIDGIVKGECKGGKPSTIVDLSVPGEPKLVRDGPIPFEQILEVYNNAWCSVAIGSDHGGFALKEKIVEHLSERGFEVDDYGTFNADSCDYPHFGHRVGHAVAEKDANFGIVVCTSGEGIMMAAAKVKGIRAGIGYDDIVVGKMREHNDANVISFGAKYMKEEDVLRRVDIFLTEKVSPEKKHHRRVKLIEKI